MKLVDLQPHWIQIHSWDAPDGTQYFHYLGSDRNKREAPGGVTFICPVHRTHRLAVWFENPADGLPPERSAEHRWHREGTTFETLSLQPSVNAQVANPTCWHGFITNGVIE